MRCDQIPMTTWDTASALKQVMDVKGVKVIQLARACNCSETYIYRMLTSGVKKLVSVEMLCKHLNIDVDEFLRIARSSASKKS